MSTVAEKLGALRKHAAFTQAAVAARAGLQRPDIAALESGRLKCTLASTRRKLASAYGVSIDAFDGYLEGRLSLEDLLEHRSAESQPGAL